MYVRVARWEGVSAENIRAAAEEIGGREGPPEGVPAKRLLMVADEDGGRLMMIPFFDSEEDLATANETLQAMTPPGEMGSPSSVEMYEVKFDLTAPQ